MEVSNIEMTKETSYKKEENDIDSVVKFPLPENMLSSLQLQDTFCSHILTQIEKGNIKEGQTYLVQKQDTKEICVILPRALTAQVLKMAHDDLGHNGIHRMYMLLKWLYYWKGLKPSVVKHVQRCYHCQ